MTSLRLSAAARDDLRDVRVHSKAAYGVGVAKTYFDGLRRVLALLRERPLAGAIVLGITPETRGFSYRSHRLYYRIVGDRVDVLRILHHARDVERTRVR